MITLRNKPSRNTLSLFDPFFIGPQSMNQVTYHRRSEAKVLTNILQTESGFEIELAAPGFEKEDFKIDVKDQKLTISLSKENVHEGGAQINKQEIFNSPFNKTFVLPQDIDVEKISATYELGILRISLVKEEKIIKNINIQ